MGLRVHANVVAGSVANALAMHNRKTGHAISQLSSGQRINSAQDDAAGSAIAERFRGQVRGLHQASGNSQDGINLLQTAESTMNEVQAVLQRMRELAVQAANDTLTASDRAAVTDKMQALSGEITRIGDSTAFNTRKLLDGSLAGGLTLQVGANCGEILAIKLDTVSAAALGVGTAQLSVDNAASASVTLCNLDDALDKISRYRGNAGNQITRLQHAISDLGIMSEKMASSESRLRDLDMARATVSLATSQILSQSGTAMLAQANAAPQAVLGLLR